LTIKSILSSTYLLSCYIRCEKAKRHKIGVYCYRTGERVWLPEVVSL